MKTLTLQRLHILRCLLLFVATTWLTNATSADHNYSPQPKVDHRGYIDVWRLREEVIFLEHHRAPDTSDSCYNEAEGDGEPETPVQLTPEQQRKALEEQKQAQIMLEACVRKASQPFKLYQAMLKKFNNAWLPVMRNAVAKGDTVAEVILLDCDTTDIFDRSEIKATCSEPELAAQARTRLTQIGFKPALYHQFDELAGNCCHAGRILELQEYLLDAIRNGYLGFSDTTLYKAIIVYGDGDKEINAKILHNAALIEAATQEFPRAFGFGGEIAGHLSNMELADAGFLKLALNRSIIKPASDSLSWGPNKYFGQEQWTAFSNFHRTRPIIGSICANGIHVAGACFKIVEGNDPEYAKEVITYSFDSEDPQIVDKTIEVDIKKLLGQGEARIQQYLQDDPRWAVFLIDRHIHHEFIPTGMQTDAAKIAPEWRGTWQLVKSFHMLLDRDRMHQSDPRDETNISGTMQIDQDGGTMRATIHTNNANLISPPDVANCALRYSGSSLKNVGYLVNNAGRDSSLEYPSAEAFAPLSPDKKYRQVLMNCAGAELLGSDQVRFLLLAENTLVEISIEGMQGFPMIIRHYQRVDHIDKPLLINSY